MGTAPLYVAQEVAIEPISSWEMVWQASQRNDTYSVRCLLPLCFFFSALCSPRLFFSGVQGGVINDSPAHVQSMLGKLTKLHPQIPASLWGFIFFTSQMDVTCFLLLYLLLQLPYLFGEGSSGSYGPLPGWLRLLPLFCFFSTFSFFYCLEEETSSSNQNMGVASSLDVVFTEMSLRLSACGYKIRFEG